MAGMAFCCVHATELIPSVTVDGKVYQNVRWGPVNQGRVVMFHSRGNAVVPLSSLPPEYQALLGNQGGAPTAPVNSPVVVPPLPSAPAQPARPSIIKPTRPSAVRDADWEAYTEERKTKVVLNNKLLNRTDLETLVGYIGSPVRIFSNTGRVTGVMLEVAEMRADVAQAATGLQLRPNLWQRTGKVAFLRNYKPEGEIGILVRLFVARDGEMDGNPSYDVAKEPSFEQWKLLRPVAGLPR